MKGDHVKHSFSIFLFTVLHDVFIPTPKPYILILGERNVSLQCYGFGFPLPVLSWYKNGTSVDIRTVTTNSSNNNVSSQLFLTTPEAGVTYKEAGNYTCEAYSSILSKKTRGTVEVLCEYNVMLVDQVRN
jgi:hypothetical protein